MSPELRRLVWGLLLRDARDLVDESLDAGSTVQPTTVVDAVMAGYRRLRASDAAELRALLVSDIAHYVSVQSS